MLDVQLTETGVGEANRGLRYAHYKVGAARAELSALADERAHEIRDLASISSGARRDRLRTELRHCWDGDAFYVRWMHQVAERLVSLRALWARRCHGAASTRAARSRRATRAQLPSSDEPDPAEPNEVTALAVGPAHERRVGQPNRDCDFSAISAQNSVDASLSDAEKRFLAELARLAAQVMLQSTMGSVPTKELR